MSMPLYLWGIELSFFSRVNFNPRFSYAEIVVFVTPNIFATADLPYRSVGLHPLLIGFSMAFPNLIQDCGSLSDIEIIVIGLVSLATSNTSSLERPEHVICPLPWQHMPSFWNLLDQFRPLSFLDSCSYR